MKIVTLIQKSYLLLSFLLIGGSCFITPRTLAGAADQPSPALNSNDSTTRDNERMKWWRAARFGMFIHWGIYAVPAHGEWYMTQGHVPRDVYAKYASRFNPTNFNARQWVETAKAAGVKYLVITSKHHDGFSMFDTKATTYNVVDSTPWHQDPLKALSEECSRQGIKFCVYYSIMDWHSACQQEATQDVEHPTYNPTTFKPGKKEEYVSFMKTQLQELVAQYHPAVLWFDGEWMRDWTEKDGQELYDYLHALDPGLIINNRIGKRGQKPGDFGTPEQTIPPNGLDGQDWETCMTINNNWGFNKKDFDWKSTATLVRNLIDIASKGGNYLLNVGPDATGEIPAPEVQRLTEMGGWLKVNGEAIYGTTASPFKNQFAWGRCTQKNDRERTILYLHVFDRPADGKLFLPGLQNKITRAYILSDPQTAVSIVVENGGVTLNLPAKAANEISSTVVLQMDGPVNIKQ
ncbi:MAG TPA: alpha-L-fucosidase [Verrucomicrobiae bacterium]|nr:alpha-L-fucosidase [Verrucomicrobiae bacterium]